MEVNKETIAMMKEALIKSVCDRTYRGKDEITDAICIFKERIMDRFKLNGYEFAGFLSLFGNINREFDDFTIKGFYSERNCGYALEIEEKKENGYYYIFLISGLGAQH